MDLTRLIAARVRGAMAAALPRVPATALARALGISPAALSRRLAYSPEVDFSIGELLKVCELTGMSPLALLADLSTDPGSEAAALEVPAPALLYLARGSGAAVQLLEALQDGRSAGAELAGAASVPLWGERAPSH